MKYSVIDNYDALPEELRKELTTLDDIDIKILKLLKDEGLLNIDNLLIGIYMEYNVSLTHSNVEQSLKKLSGMGEIRSQKGVYCIKKKGITK